MIERELKKAIAVALSRSESDPLLLAEATFDQLTAEQQRHLAFAGWHNTLKHANRNRRNRLTAQTKDLVRIAVPGPDGLQRWHFLKDASIVELRQYRADHLQRAEDHAAKADAIQRLIDAMEEAGVDRVADLPDWVDILSETEVEELLAA